MDGTNEVTLYIRMLEKIKNDLKNMDDCTSLLEMREKIHELVGFIEAETSDSRAALSEMIYSRIVETKGVNPELNTSFYILYRNLMQNKLSLKEAKRQYDLYSKEISGIRAL